ncbi:MAG: CHAT domain-containing protein [Gemmatimonadaceae bacterium]
MADSEIPRARCSAAQDDDVSPDVIDVAARTAAAVHADADPAALHAAALIDLVWATDSGKTLGRSISYLLRASQLGERPAPAASDLAAAYIVRAERTQDVRDLLDAIEQAARALEQEPSDAAARFNLALAMDHLGLQVETARAWSQFLAVDSTSGWAAEARTRLQLLDAESRAARHAAALNATPRTPADLAALAVRAPQEARIWGWNRSLGEWGTATLRGDTAVASRRLADASILGQTLERRGGDATLADAVRAIRAREHNPRAMVALARAHEAYAAGQASYTVGEYETARRHFANAIADSRASAPLRRWARLFLGTTLAYSKREKDGERLLRAMDASADTTREPALAARAHWVLGMMLLRGGQYETALNSFSDSEHLFSLISEREHRGATQTLASDAAFTLGNSEAGYVLAHHALWTLRPYQGSIWIHNLLGISARAAAADGLLRAAIHLSEERAAAAAETGQQAYVAEATLARARLLIASGNTARAGSEIAAARTIVGKLPPGFERDWLSADLQLTEADGPLRGDAAHSLAALDSAATMFEGWHYTLRLLTALLTRADVRLSAGDAIGGKADLDRATAILQDEHNAIEDAATRASLLDAARGVFDRQVMLSVAAGRPKEALTYLERGRASLTRVASHRLRSSGERIISPSGEVLVEYALIGDTLLTWTISGTVVQLSRATVNHALLVRAIGRARAALETGAADAAVQPALTLLYDWLIRPVAPQIGSDGVPLVLVTDGELSGAPFAALYDAKRRRYLVEAHPIRFVPRLADAGAATPKRRSRPHRALLVGDPAFDAKRFPTLERLNGASAELRVVTLEYPNAEVLEGAAANSPAVEASLPAASIVHYAGHALVDDERPDQSFLLLAPVRKTDGKFTVARIKQLDLRRVQLVVLSACETFRPSSSRSGGFSGLAQAFVAAGAHGVVGGQWRIDDQLARAFMVDFHHAYRKTENASGALRVTQLQFIHSTNPTLRSPSAWAGFRYVGG